MNVHLFARLLGTIARCLILAALAFAVPSAWAQSGSAPAPASQAPPDPSPQSSPQDGDVLRLKSGKELIGQVRSQSASHYVLEVIPGVVIQVPRAQVLSVSFDDKDKQGSEAGGANDATNAPRTVVESARVSTDLNRRLYRSLIDGADEEAFVDRPVAAIIDDLSRRSGVPIDVDEAFRRLPDDRRIWSVQLKPDTSLIEFLNGPFQDRYPQARIEFQYDRVVLDLQEDAANDNGDEQATDVPE